MPVFQKTKNIVGKDGALVYNIVQYVFLLGVSMSGMYPVLVRVRGIQRDETGRENTIESVSAGRHSVKNGKHYVLYDDLLLNEKQKTPTVMKFHDGELVLLRRGGMDQELRFRKGMQTQSKYRTPYGTLDMAVRTTRLDICCGLLEGRIDEE